MDLLTSLKLELSAISDLAKNLEKVSLCADSWRPKKADVNGFQPQVKQVRSEIGRSVWMDLSDCSGAQSYPLGSCVFCHQCSVDRDATDSRAEEWCRALSMAVILPRLVNQKILRTLLKKVGSSLFREYWLATSRGSACCQILCVLVLVESTNSTGGGRVESHVAMPASRYGKQSGRRLAHERGVGAT